MSRKNKETIEQKIVGGFFRGVWWLVSLPFKGLRRRKKLTLEEKKYILAKKQEIEKSLSKENQLELRHAVLEADKLVDWALKECGYRGQTFADRLRAAEKDIPKAVYNSIWRAHKIRNQIVHETESNLKGAELKDAVYKFFIYLSQI